MTLFDCTGCGTLVRGECSLCRQLAGHSVGFKRGYATYLRERAVTPVTQTLKNTFGVGTPERSGFERARKDEHERAKVVANPRR